jgi:hypothetical protein
VKFQQVYCVLDTEFRLLWVGGDWDEFALSNGGSGAVANEVLSTSLLAHISDQETQQAVLDMVKAVQDAQEPLRLIYRCDSPHMQRLFMLTIQPMKETRVLMVHDLQDAVSFPEPLRPWQVSPEATARKCSFCGAVKQSGDIWRAVVAMPFPHPEKVAYTVCPDCMERVHQAISAVRNQSTLAVRPSNRKD